jgi:hypothetical protein
VLANNCATRTRPLPANPCACCMSTGVANPYLHAYSPLNITDQGNGYYYPTLTLVIQTGQAHTIFKRFRLGSSPFYSPATTLLCWSVNLQPHHHRLTSSFCPAAPRHNGSDGPDSGHLIRRRGLYHMVDTRRQQRHRLGVRQAAVSQK